MKNSNSPSASHLHYSNYQLTMLVILRLTIGWHFLYEGLSKVFNPDWSAAGYLMDSKGIFAEIFYSMATNPTIMDIVNFLNIWGLTVIGLFLILGFLTRYAIIGGMILLAFYYLSHPPFIGLNYAIPSEGNYLIVNKNLIELLSMWVLLLFPTWKRIGIDRLLFHA